MFFILYSNREQVTKIIRESARDWKVCLAWRCMQHYCRKVCSLFRFVFNIIRLDRPWYIVGSLFFKFFPDVMSHTATTKSTAILVKYSYFFLFETELFVCMNMIHEETRSHQPLVQASFHTWLLDSQVSLSSSKCSILSASWKLGECPACC